MVTGYVLVDLSWLQHISGISMQDTNSQDPSVFRIRQRLSTLRNKCILNSTIKPFLQTETGPISRILHVDQKYSRSSDYYLRAWINRDWIPWLGRRVPCSLPRRLLR